MDQKNLMTQTLGYLKKQRQRRWWLRMVTGLAAVVVFVTTYLLIMPAITMENSTFEATVSSVEAVLGEPIDVLFSAAASDEQDETVFVITADGDNAGLDDSRLTFDGEGAATIPTENGATVTLHREYDDNGCTRYWFSLKQGQSVRFSLSWINGVGRFRSQTVAEEVPVEPAADGEQQETACETVYRSETVLVSAGDPAQAGSLLLMLGHGASAEDTQRQDGKTFAMIWAQAQAEESGESSALLEADDSEGTSNPAEEPGGEPVGGDAVAATQDINGAHDFGPDITLVTVSKLVNGQWEPATEFTEGDNVRVTIDYQISANTVGVDNRTIYYQLPDGINLPQGEGGTVYDGTTPVGTYTISADGLITIVFNEDFADNESFTGRIQFQGTLSADETGSDTTIDFGASGKITVVPDTDESDVRVAKSGSFNQEDEKLHYTIDVTTTKGTGGPVTVTDAFQTGNTSATYDADSFTIVKVDADGNKTAVEGYKPDIFDAGWTGAPQQFTIAGLPELKSGESYKITYTATPGKTASADGYSSVDNVAEAKIEGDSSSDWNQVVVHRNMLEKWGTYDSSTQTITWNITINPDGLDISGYELTDKLNIFGDVEVTLPDSFTLKGSSGTETTITLPYTFPEGSDDTYTITYQTKVDGLDAGEQVQVNNQVDLTGDDNFTAGGSVSPQGTSLNSSKQFNNVSSATEETGIYQWQGWISVPANLGSDQFESLTYIDTLYDLTTTNDQGETITVEGSHYITGAQLRAMAVRTDVGSTGELAYEQDYYFCTVDEDGTERILTTAKGDFDANVTYTNFKVKFREAALSRMQNGIVWLDYATTVDYSKLESHTTYIITNRGGIADHERDASTTYTKPGKLDKQASITGDNGSYTDAGITVDFEASGGIIRYRLLIHTDARTTGDITVTDLLPAGATLVEDSVTMAFYGNDYWEYDSITWANGVAYKAADRIHAEVEQTNEDGTTQVTFTIDDGYNGDGAVHTLAVYYQVNVADDPRWTDNPTLEDHLYTNKASWGTESVENDVTVEREVPNLSKTGEQLPQYDENGDLMVGADGSPLLSNTVRYTVIVNQGGKDLDPDNDVLTLTDTLSVGSAAGAEFHPETVKLYHYDATAEGHLGQEIDSHLYAFTYDPETYTITFTLPDELACVLVYEYAIDRGNAAGNINISNEAHLTGGSGSSSKNDVSLVETSSSATVSRKVLSIYKVDADNYGVLLPGAVFQLEEYQPDGSWSMLDNDLVTDGNGLLTLNRTADEEFDKFTFKDNTLYRLTEITAPSGYEASADPFYFVWVKEGQTADQVKQEMSSQMPNGVSTDDVRFLTESGSLYVPNQSTTLTVYKVWLDEDGYRLDTPGADSVDVILYQQPVTTNKKTVTVTSTGHQSWSTTYTSSVDVAEDSSLTIQITGVYIGSLDIQVGNGTAVPVPTGDGQVWTYTIDRITEDTAVRITPTDQAEGNSFGDITFPSYTEPGNVPVGEATEYETVKLNADNNWSYTWTNLPKQNEAGQTVYYRVEETKVPGFQVSYSSNNQTGIQTGSLVISNRSSGYVLPQTGGAGIAPLIVGGLAFIAMATLMVLHRKEREAS